MHHHADRAGEGEGKGLLLVLRSDLDDYARDKRDACRACRYDSVCEGVWKNYVKRYGWEEMRAVPDLSRSLDPPDPIGHHREDVSS
jgi:cyclic pyranopterin phosphate synthase